MDQPLPVERHGEDGVAVRVDDVDRDTPGNVPDNDCVVIAGAYKDVLCCGMPLNYTDSSPNKIKYSIT